MYENKTFSLLNNLKVEVLNKVKRAIQKNDS